METYLSIAMPISWCLFPLWWGIAAFIWRKIMDWMDDGPCLPVDIPVSLFIALLLAVGVPILPFVAVGLVVIGGPAWLVYKGLTWVSQNIEVKWNKE